MNIKDISQVIEELYYNGRAIAGRKLDMRDFLMLARMANGSIMRKLYYEEKQLQQQYWYFGSQLETRTYKLSEPDKRNRRFITIENNPKNKDEEKGVLRLPHGLGVFNIEPLGDYDGPDMARSEPGSEWLYTGPAFEGMPRWTPMGTNKYAVINLDDCVTEVEVIGIFNDEDLDIPMDIAFDIVVQVMQVVLKVINVPVDKTNDDDPNTKEIKKQLNSLP